MKIDLSHNTIDSVKKMCLDERINFSSLDCTILFQSDFVHSKCIRDIILFLFEQNNISIPWKTRFSLISDELVNNSIEYGSQSGDINECHIHLHAKDNKLSVVIEIWDTGKGLYAKNSHDMEEIRKFKQEVGFDNYLGKRGRGLFQMVSKIVDELYFRDREDGGLVVGVKKVLDLV